jgi:drug/metabolite transporter (DMT)-like permease
VRAASAIGYLGAVTAVQAVILLAAIRLDWGRIRASARAGTGIGIGSLAAYLLVLLAYQRAPASPVATLRELSILLGILMAKERPGGRVWLGGALCVLGAALTVL